MNFNLKVILAAIACWLAPGSGYFILGKKCKALFLLCSVIFLAVAGIILADFRDVRFLDNPYYYLGRFGSGFMWLASVSFLGESPRGIIPDQYFDFGHLYLCVAGVLNTVIALSVFIQSPQQAVLPEACKPELAKDAERELLEI
ncbi:MAG: hypothetical protein HY811_12200 [Planctomycetes bacterium]|nr:hypothetical protein [Planctomycetota bacterium]